MLSKCQVSLPWSSMVLHHLKPTRILENKILLRLSKVYLPASDVFYCPEVKRTKYQDNDVHYYIVRTNEAEEDVEYHGAKFEGHVKDTRYWMRRVF